MSAILNFILIIFILYYVKCQFTMVEDNINQESFYTINDNSLPYDDDNYSACDDAHPCTVNEDDLKCDYSDLCTVKDSFDTFPQRNIPSNVKNRDLEMFLLFILQIIGIIPIGHGRI